MIKERSSKEHNHFLNSIKSNRWRFCKLFLAIFDFVGVCISIVGLCPFLGISTTGKVFFIITFVVLLVACVALLLLIRAEKNDSIKEASRYAALFHILCHKLRDDMREELDSLRENNSESINEKKARRHITEKQINFLTELATQLSEITHCKIRASIKLFEEMNIEDDKKNNRGPVLFTFARNNVDGHQMETEQHKKILINENTDFEYILNLPIEYDNIGKHFFYQENLKKYEIQLKKQNKKYKNSNKKWRKTYNTTVVLPIRYLEDNGDKPFYGILGFLCVDSLDTKAFSSKSRPFILDFLKGITDSLYIFYYECSIYFWK